MSHENASPILDAAQSFLDHRRHELWDRSFPRPRETYVEQMSGIPYRVEYHPGHDDGHVPRPFTVSLSAVLDGLTACAELERDGRLKLSLRSAGQDSFTHMLEIASWDKSKVLARTDAGHARSVHIPEGELESITRWCDESIRDEDILATIQKVLEQGSYDATLETPRGPASPGYFQPLELAA
jgi:hypothetical protein